MAARVEQWNAAPFWRRETTGTCQQPEYAFPSTAKKLPSAMDKKMRGRRGEAGYGAFAAYAVLQSSAVCVKVLLLRPDLRIMIPAAARPAISITRCSCARAERASYSIL